MTQENIPNPAVNQTSDLPTDAAFVLSLIGGVLITIGSICGNGIKCNRKAIFLGMGGLMGGGYGMMGGHYYYGTNSYYGMMYGFELLELIMGALVIVFALLMRSKPADRKTYGLLIIVFSLASFVGMGGFFIGAILDFIGGVLALS
jgi:hypothetical protein